MPFLPLCNVYVHNDLLTMRLQRGDIKRHDGNKLCRDDRPSPYRLATPISVVSSRNVSISVISYWQSQNKIYQRGLSYDHVEKNKICSHLQLFKYSVFLPRRWEKN